MFYAVGDFILGCGHNKTTHEQIVEIEKIREENNKEEKSVQVPEAEQVKENCVSEEEFDCFDMGL